MSAVQHGIGSRMDAKELAGHAYTPMDAGKTPCTAGLLEAASESITACEYLFVEVAEGSWLAVEMQGTMGVRAKS